MAHHEAFEHHEHHDSSVTCRTCSRPVDPGHKAVLFGLCHHCIYKILLVFFIVMIILSYVVWVGIL